jgi:hypothetical protein
MRLSFHCFQSSKIEREIKHTFFIPHFCSLQYYGKSIDIIIIKAVVAVAKVPHARDNVEIAVQLLVNGGGHDPHPGKRVCHSVEALRCTEQRCKHNALLRNLVVLTKRGQEWKEKQEEEENTKKKERGKGYDGAERGTNKPKIMERMMLIICHL